MKKLMHYLALALLLSAFAPAALKAEEPFLSSSAMSENLGRANEKASLARLKTIREMAKTRLSKSEKKALREEVISIRNKHKGPSGAIYISTGGFILILILLIILL